MVITPTIKQGNDMEKYFLNPMKEKAPTKRQIEDGMKKIESRNKAFKVAFKKERVKK
jgi:hypothetical protein